MLIKTPWNIPQDDAPTLILSMRQVSALVGYCALYEFEDLVAEMLDARVGYLVSEQRLAFTRRLYKAIHTVAGSGRLAAASRALLSPAKLTQDYDLFFPVFNHIYEAFALNAITGWRKRCNQAICYLGEAWTAEMPEYLAEQLSDFDHIFTGTAGAVDRISKLSGRPCTYVPRAVDALLFCPFPNAPERFIDICSIGRRSSVTHEALLEHVRGTGQFYYYDTSVIRSGNLRSTSFGVHNCREHRFLLSNLLKRSRYFVANRAQVDLVALTAGQEEIAGRFYEGAAAGTVMIGLPPDSDEFRRQFDWDGAAIPVDFHAPGIGDRIAQADRDPERLARISKDNVVNSLLRHDWVYRLRDVLAAIGRPPTERMLAREQQLATVAANVRAGDSAELINA